MKRTKHSLEIQIQRLRVGLLQYEVAARAGIHPSRLSQIENGRVTPREDELQRIREIIRA